MLCVWEGRGKIVKLYSSVSTSAPNPRRVRIFLAEKGLDIPRVDVDLGKLDQLTPEFGLVNPFRRVPVLELDDGTRLSESIAICRYLEELHPDPPLFGIGPLGRATVEMQQRKLELNLLFNVALAFRHSHPAMAKMESPQVPEMAPIGKRRAQEALAVFDAELADRPFIAGDAFSVADITGLVGLDFCKLGRVEISEDFKNLRRWWTSLAARPSAKA